jgi:hypothetical protein
MFNVRFISIRKDLLFLFPLSLMLIAACGPIQTLFEPPSPRRTFTVNDLIIDQNKLPTNWQAFTPFFPSGDDLATKESIAIRFGALANGLNNYYAEEDIYRYPTIGIAKREFNYWFSKHPGIIHSVSEWKYQSAIADESRFACDPMNGSNFDEYCEWAGRYDEFIIVFNTQMIKNEMTLNDLEKVVKAIDTLMAEHLGKTKPTH